ncbi:MAG: C39 family peptidase [Candidatus Moraniibacteriota bacterium]|jgi:hypothetical protein
MVIKRKIIKKTFGYLLALIILASLILIWSKNKLSLEELVKPEIISEQVEILEVSQKKTEIITEQKNIPEVVPEKTENITIAEPSSASSDAEALANKETAEGKKNLPTKMLIDVPFTSQAPLSKWDAYHEEACEEASLLMVEYFLKNKKLTPALAEKEIQALIAYEIKNTKGYEDSNTEETVKLGADYYGLKNLRVVYDFTPADLKKYLAQKKPIIIPAAGRLLGNPNFTAPGPLYHNLVLIGYDGDTIITNDPGTRKGQSYRYDIKTLFSAIHDFPGDKNKIEKGRKAMIVIE